MSHAVPSPAPESGRAPEPDERPLPGDAPEERRRLPARTATYWRVQALLTGVPVVALATLGAVTLRWPPEPLRWTVAALLFLWLVVLRGLVAPPIRRRRFWYCISADEIDLQHGVLMTTRTLVPMNRVQHLKTTQGALADRFRVASLHVHTAGGVVALHGMDRDEAARVRRRIGALAGLADDV
ncbi:PH domain-containing protein [Nakamurella endophytica]|uniref:YdbS-like PH domain-containing protein n=1 Tax=Nakamurella endophytica TaxID=1748367 RepID=A0A917SKM3_9ACTN|nr:PH domain-containing protein [Nakamurella endophytica]GGL85085.1 hypothetical protein GCM10011594_00880 [Nakamurella endophytica]